MPTVAEPFGVLHDRAVYLPDPDALVVADLHLGLVATSAVDAPLEAGPAVVDRLTSLLDRFSPAAVVLAGDVLHAFDTVPLSARDALSAVVDTVTAAGAELVLLEGNHDAQLAAVTDRPVESALAFDDGTVVCHGHVRPEATGDRYVVGHDHPTIEIEGRRRPCYLYGPGVEDGADVLALPAFTPAVRGTLVNRLDDGDALSPFLASVTRFHPVVWDEDAGSPLVFPPLGSLQAYL